MMDAQFTSIYNRAPASLPPAPIEPDVYRAIVASMHVCPRDVAGFSRGLGLGLFG
jgi:hypothetical protein